MARRVRSDKATTMCLMKRVARWAAALAAAAVIGGCARPVTVKDYATPDTACCSSVSEFKFRPMALGQDIELSFTPQDPAYAFAGRREHFIALKVPDGFTPTMIQVRSYLKGALLPTASAVIPDFYYLGADFAVIGQESTSDFREASGFRRTAITARVPVVAGAKYIVVVAGDGGNGIPVVRSENHTPYRIPPAPLRDFSLRLFGEPVGK